MLKTAPPDEEESSRAVLFVMWMIPCQLHNTKFPLYRSACLFLQNSINRKIAPPGSQSRGSIFYHVQTKQNQPYSFVQSYKYHF